MKILLNLKHILCFVEVIIPFREKPAKLCKNHEHVHEIR